MKSMGIILGSALVLCACASPAPNRDAQLAAQIKQEIAQTEGIGSARSVNVETANGVVILSGFIDTEQQKYDAAQTALKTSGVQTVFNNLQVIRPDTSVGSSGR